MAERKIEGKEKERKTKHGNTYCQQIKERGSVSTYREVKDLAVRCGGEWRRLHHKSLALKIER